MMINNVIVACLFAYIYTNACTNSVLCFPSKKKRKTFVQFPRKLGFRTLSTWMFSLARHHVNMKTCILVYWSSTAVN